MNGKYSCQLSLVVQFWKNQCLNLEFLKIEGRKVQEGISILRSSAAHELAMMLFCMFTNKQTNKQTKIGVGNCR